MAFWSVPPGLPEAAALTAAPTWPDPSAAWISQPEWPPPDGDLDAFGKGKGKDMGPKQPLECYGCFGKGHPQRLCPTPPGMAGKPGAAVCENCFGKGHGKAQCTSKSGGKHEQPGFGKGKGKDGGKGYGKGFGNKGKGKGMYGVDDQHPGAEWGQQWPEWSSAQTAATAAFQQSTPPPPQFPWMAAAAAVPSDP